MFSAKFGLNLVPEICKYSSHVAMCTCVQQADSVLPKPEVIVPVLSIAAAIHSYTDHSNIHADYVGSYDTENRYHH